MNQSAHQLIQEEETMQEKVLMKSPSLQHVLNQIWDFLPQFLNWTDSEMATWLLTLH